MRPRRTILEGAATPLRSLFVAAVCSKMLHPAGGGAMHFNNFNELGGKWLGNLDSNQDKQSQSLLCYHYTIPHPSPGKPGAGRSDQGTAGAAARRFAIRTSGLLAAPSRLCKSFLASECGSFGRSSRNVHLARCGRLSGLRAAGKWGAGSRDRVAALINAAG